ncbi:hypothetical protein GPDM_03365 [Planococcus donghaensis MPA1U2]|uniref:Dockerin type 1 n=1 Tax=Planococcus donghaensis MPA1U2 TaxID=933115 RepID=E7RDZ1_9BACL|nr:carbohydrate-binding domain-containing protein [Planococcus donghaensis]EGA90805.1 hypothetical protein GPDM_03365 [Planococcus donghaensis MPA1U2]
MPKNKRMFKLAATLLSASLLFACTNETNETTDTQQSTAATSDAVVAEQMTSLVDNVVTYTDEDEYTDWQDESPFEVELNGDSAEFASSAAIIFEDNVLTIKAGGTYVFTGNLDDGQIVVDSEGKKTVRLVLNGVEINSSENSAIYIKDAEKAVISLAEGTENSISDSANYVMDESAEDELDAAIFSKSDLTINGSGQLTVTGNYKDGITSKDELKVTGGNIQVTAVDNGLKGRDLVAIKDGAFVIEAGGDGIKSTNDEDATKGSIALEGGTFDITSGNDAIQAETDLMVTDGTYTILAGGGSPETIQEAGDPEPGTAVETEVVEDIESTKGLKAGGAIDVSGGIFTIDSLDDAVNSNSDITIAGGQWDIATGEDGVHADNALVITNGEITVARSYEGLEGNFITIDDGTIDVTATDDGINVSDGTSVTTGPPVEVAEEDKVAIGEGGEPVMTINGGFITVDGLGDGLDANGSIVMTGGTVLVEGPTRTMDGSIDYDNGFDLTGGIIIAAGSTGMVQATSEETAQESIVMTFPEIQEAGTIVHLQDSEGTTIATYAPSREFSAIFISTPDLEIGTSYTLSSGGTSSAEETAGLYADGGYEGGTELVDFTITESVTWLNEDGITEASVENPGGGAGVGAGAGTGGRGAGGTPPEAGALPPDMPEMDEETEQKVQEIRDQQMAGTITEEQAQEQLAELGIEMPTRPVQ